MSTRVWEPWEIPNPVVDDARALLAEAAREERQRNCEHEETVEITELGTLYRGVPVQGMQPRDQGGAMSLNVDLGISSAEAVENVQRNVPRFVEALERAGFCFDTRTALAAFAGLAGVIRAAAEAEAKALRDRKLDHLGGQQ